MYGEFVYSQNTGITCVDRRTVNVILLYFSADRVDGNRKEKNKKISKLYFRGDKTRSPSGFWR